MKITEDVRAYAAKMELDESAALAAGMAEKAAEFKARGGEVYNRA
ncbi:MAG: hypothetical protein FLDDKLPJ_03789 [Phycisphaerae bacterium]|nr:hypothetical protein [Phycisphaerae bacterium]